MTSMHPTDKLNFLTFCHKNLNLKTKKRACSPGVRWKAPPQAPTTYPFIHHF